MLEQAQHLARNWFNSLGRDSQRGMPRQDERPPLDPQLQAMLRERAMMGQQVQ